MLTSGIKLINFKIRKNSKNIKKKFNLIIKNRDEIINSISINYKNKYKQKQLANYKKYSNFKLIGMGGSILGTQTIYEFLKHKIKKNFVFFDNLKKKQIIDKKKSVNIIVSKSGNTIETIVNASIIIKKKR